MTLFTLVLCVAFIITVRLSWVSLELLELSSYVEFGDKVQSMSVVPLNVLDQVALSVPVTGWPSLTHHKHMFPYKSASLRPDVIVIPVCPRLDAFLAHRTFAVRTMVASTVTVSIFLRICYHF